MSKKYSLWADGVSHSEIRALKVKFILVGQLTVIVAWVLGYGGL